MPDVERLPLFLLPMSALPGEEVPLHVFEPRYRALVQHCLDHEVPFGVLLADDEGVREIGCAVVIEDVTKRHDDGRLEITTRGTKRFRLDGEVVERDFPGAPVSWLHDDPIDPHDEEDDTDAVALFSELAERVTGAVPELGDDGDTSFLIAARVAFGGAAKQGLLELRSEGKRLALLERLLRAALARLSQVELRQAQARSNGRVHFE